MRTFQNGLCMIRRVSVGKLDATPSLVVRRVVRTNLGPIESTCIETKIFTYFLKIFLSGLEVQIIQADDEAIPDSFFGKLPKSLVGEDVFSYVE